MPRMTHTQSNILGYLISVGGSELAGSTVKEIRDATGLGHNATYTALRQGVPGVKPCRSTTKTGATMYYAEPLAMAPHPDAITEAKPAPISIWDSAEWANVDPGLFASLDIAYRKAPASEVRIGELIDALNAIESSEMLEAERLMRYAVGGQAIAMLALDLIQESNG